MFSAIFRYFKKADKILLFLSLLCSIYGLVLINSATASYDTDQFITIQALAIGIGIFAFIIVSLIDIDRIGIAWRVIFVLNIALQCALLFYGVGGDTTGNNSWIRFGSIGIQPAEVGKILFIFTFSMHTALLRERMNHIKHLSKLLIHAGIIFATVMYTSNDMGMALAYGVITVIILFIGGLSMKWFYAAGIAVLALVPIVWNFVLASYQKLRILVIFDPTLDPDKAYQGLQSQTAIGSGGFYGTGYLEGNLTQFGGLPAKHTDFIFSVAAEEFGFVGAMTIIVLLSLLIIRLFFVCFIAPTDLGSLICAGIGGMFLFQSIQNILMCLAITPVIGLTLPFFSYGGTSIVTMFIAVGIVSGIKARETPEHLKNQ
ncbi:MAG: FtsW/RodA/SpoVE family cell cycle protein [Clostridia bacterium]